MKIIEITGKDLRAMLDQFSGDTSDIRIVRVAIDEDVFKFKVNEYTWSPPLGEPMKR